ISGTSSGNVTEDVSVISGNVASSGSLNISDTDLGQSTFVAQPSVAGTYGTFSLETGSASCSTADNSQTAIQQLGAGQTLTDSFTASLFDGTATQAISVTNHRTNDIPLISGT